jgi:hypothetical protein
MTGFSTRAVKCCGRSPVPAAKPSSSKPVPSYTSLGACRSHAYSGRTAIIVEYLQTPAKAFTRDLGSKDLDLDSHFGSDLGEGIPGAFEIDRNDLAHLQDNRGLSQRNAGGVNKVPANDHTIWHVKIYEVEAGSLIHGYADRGEADADRKDFGSRLGCTKSQ